MLIRPPAAAGVLYPADEGELRTSVRGWLRDAPLRGPSPKALIVPHTGYDDIGPVIATAYTQLAQDRAIIRRIILLGPAHFVRLAGVALSSAEAFATPLGSVEVDRETIAHLAQQPYAEVEDFAHAFEHSLELQLPFLQETLSDVVIVPLVVGEMSPEMIGLLLATLWGGHETRIIVSSDLSHSFDALLAETLDETTAHVIETLERPGLFNGMACGREAINGLLWTARARHMRVQRVALGYSSRSAGPSERVGYGVFAFTEDR